MKCHPLRWIWGLVPLLIFSYLATVGIKDRVEADLTARTTRALQAAGMGWAKVHFDGRDGILSGEAADESEPGKAIELASAISGVRVLDGQADLLKKVEPYTWQAEFKEGRVSLSGFVPNETTHKSVLAAVKSALSPTEIDDKVELARGNPPLAEWLEGIRFGLKELAQMRHGRVHFSGILASAYGEALSPSSYKQLSAAYTSGLPKALKLGTFAVTPPVIKPYKWKAKYVDNQLVLTGFVPSEQEQVELLTHAKRAFPKANIVDKLELGVGPPDNFGRAARSSLDQLATLQQGSAELDGDAIALEGIAADDKIAETARRAVKADAPPNFKVAEAIRGLIPVAKPFTTMIDANPGFIELIGFVPSDRERAAILAAVKQSFPGREVRDHLKLAAGEPPGYGICVGAAVKALGRLGSGRAELSDKALRISGTTEDESVAHGLSAEVSTQTGADCESEVKIAYDDSAKRTAAEREDAKRKEAERLAAEKRDAAEKAIMEAKRVAAAEEVKRAAAEQEAKRAAATPEVRKTVDACEGDLRNTASSGIINFETASDVLSRQSRPTLRALAAVALRCNSVLIEIAGHTDSEGHPERQQPLSERRAQAVANFLIDQGVEAARIRAVGYGDTRPIAPNDTQENRAKNRRIEFSVKIP